MISRNQIRQAAAQYLYGMGMDGTNEGNEAGMEPFWDIVLEPMQASYYKAKAKAVEHLTRDHSDKLRLFQTRARDVIERLQGEVRADSLREGLGEILVREEAFQQALANLRNARKNDPDCENGAVEQAFAQLKILNDTLLQFRKRFLDMMQDMPEYARQSVALIKAVERLQEIGLRVDALDDPGTGMNKAEFANVLELADDMKKLRSEAGELISRVVASKDELDLMINGVVENFSSDRVSPVERAIIRIASYELKYKPELPTAVIASEAIRLAEKYSITEAPRFINGVLASIARACRQDEPPAAE